MRVVWVVGEVVWRVVSVKRECVLRELRARPREPNVCVVGEEGVYLEVAVGSRDC